MTHPVCQITSAPAHSRPFQFSLRALFAVITLASLVSAAAAVAKRIEESWTAAVLRMEQEREAVEELRKLGGIVDYSGPGALVQLGGTKIADADLAIVKRVYSARYISLYDTAISDVGLVHLRNLENLERLDLSHTQVTAEGVASLQRVLPSVAIYKQPE